MTWHNWTHDGKSHPATGTVTGVNTTNLGTPTFTYYTGTRVDPAHRLSKPPVNAGTYTVVAHYPGNRNYTAADSKPVTVVVR